MLHVRGDNLPGLNFVPEAQLTPPAEEDADGHLLTPNPAITSNGLNGTYYAPPNGWQVCSNTLVSSHCLLYMLQRLSNNTVLVHWSQDSTMLADHPVSAVAALQFLVDNSYMRLLYNGEFDLNCNLLGAFCSVCLCS